MTNHLQRRGTTYYVRLDIPEALRDHYGKTSLKKSLKTGDLATAKTLAAQYVAEWRLDMQRVLGHYMDDIGPNNIGGRHRSELRTELDRWKIELYEQARPHTEVIRLSRNPQEVAQAKAALTKLQENAKAKYGDTPELPEGELERQLQQYIEQKAKKPSSFIPNPIHYVVTGPASEEIEEIAQGRLVPRNDLFRPALLKRFSEAQEGHIEQKTHDMRMGAVKELAKFFKASGQPLEKAGVTAFLETIKDQATATKKRKLSSGKLYFDFLQEQGLVPESSKNPFSGHKLKERQKEAAKAKRQPFKRQQIEALYAEAVRRDDADLANAILIAAYTGMRIEEVCKLTGDSVEDGLFTVMDSKTAAGHREIPIHSAIAEHIANLCEQNGSDYLIQSTANNKYGFRSDVISKRFATVKKSLGYGSTLVFHSIRKSVATFLEHAGVSESVAADILGHEKPTMTFGLYSGGSSIEQRREAVERLSYKLL